MTDSESTTVAAPYYGATPITLDALAAEFEATIDRIVAGETFVVLIDGKSTVYMVPYEEYQSLVGRARAPLSER